MKLLNLIIILVILLELTKKNNTYHKIKSNIDNELYLVQKNKETEQKNADRLANVNSKINILIKSLSNSKHRQLLEEKSITLRESNTNEIGYTLNKEHIGLCIDKDDNALFFVAVHELAHVITPEYGHTKNFWNNFKYLLEHAIKAGLYRYEDYNKNPTIYCDEKISYTPIKK